MARSARPSVPRRLKEKPAFRVLIAGASGTIGRELTRQLEADGHVVLRLVRGRPQGPAEFNWAPSARIIDFGLLDTVDAVINLSGAPLGRVPWTASYRRQILQSRVQATQTLAEAMGRAQNPPAIFLSASAAGYYGDRPAERLTEESAKGQGFLSDVVMEWEQAAEIAPETSRVVAFRSGLVISREGALKPLLAMTRLGLGLRIGTGGQHWPWISLYDEAAAIRHLLHSPLSGAVNLAGPTPATSDRITRYLARSLHRGYGSLLTDGVIQLALREAGTDLLLSSQKVLPARLLADGFRFRDGTVESAIDSVLSTARSAPS